MYSFENREMDAYFQSLPPIVQHSIIMCDLKPGTLEELETLARTMNGDEDEKEEENRA